MIYIRRNDLGCDHDVRHVILCRIANDVNGVATRLDRGDRGQQLPTRRDDVGVAGAKMLT